MPPSKALPRLADPGCWVVTQSAKYYRVGDMCIKRTLRQQEWSTHNNKLYVTPEMTMPQRWRNDAAILYYLREHTDIPVPKVLGLFEDDGAFYHCTEYVAGLPMDKLSREQQVAVMPELLRHIATMKSLTSDTPWVPPLPLNPPPPEKSVVLPTKDYGPKPELPLLSGPPNVTDLKWKPNSCWHPHKDVRGRFVLCHNDLDTHNILVDPETLKITAIIDWEYGGFLPEWFEQRFWEKVTRCKEGEEPSWEFGLRGHTSEEELEEYTWRCREWLMENCDEVEMPYPRTLKDKLGDDLQTPEDHLTWSRENRMEEEVEAWEEWKEKKRKKAAEAKSGNPES